MHIVLDSDVIRGADFTSSNLFSFLEHSASLLGYQIHIPALVIDEVTAQIEEELQNAKQQGARSSRRWGRILDRPLKSSLDGLDPREGASLLRRKLESYASVLLYPGVSHQELTLRAIRRKKPFNEKGSGYRDSLIWESVMQLAPTVDGRIILLSQDSDFTDKDKVNLAEELKADMVERGLEENKVVLIRSVQDFVDTYIRPQLKQAQLKEILEGDLTEALSKLNMDPHETIALWVQDEYFGKEWTGEQLGLPWEYETLHLSMVEDVSNLERLEAREISQDEYLLRVAATLQCEFDAFVDKSNAFTLDGFSISVFDWNRLYASGDTMLELRCELDISIKFPTGTNPEISVLSMELVEP